MRACTLKTTKLLKILFCSLSLYFLANINSAYARAGGGGSYSHDSSHSSSSSSSSSSRSSSSSSGSRSSGSSSGTSSSNFNLSEMSLWQKILFFAIILSPLVGIVWAVMRPDPSESSSKSGMPVSGGGSSNEDIQSKKQSGRRRKRRVEATESPKSSESVRQEMMARDINFKPKKFLERFDQAFLKIQNAWSQQSIETMRPFVTDGVYERFSIQLQEFKIQELVNKISDIQILERSIELFESDGSFDLLTVKVSAKMKDEFYSQAGKLIKESEEPFTEFWTFLRHINAKTKEADGLIEAACPCCGASIAKNQNAKCGSCQSALRSGEFDWVLSEISQQDTEVRCLIPYSDVKKVEVIDPDFSVQLLEDRAAVIFWRIALAKRLKEPRILEKVTSPENAKSMQGFLTCFDIGVGSIELERLYSSGSQMKAELRVIWSSKNKPHGETSSGVSPMILTRHQDGVSLLSRQLGAFHCNGCGAAVTDEVASHCSHCGGAYYDPKNQWNLEMFGDCGIKSEDGKIAS